jgi:tetratricopeptide (TPR) repeat protein
VAKLIELNESFDGDMKTDTTDGVVTTLDMRTDDVTDIRPLKVFSGLKFVNLSGTNTKTFNGQLRDISPLAGMQLEELSVSGTKVSDLSPLAGMPLKLLVLNNTRVRDLSPLAGMKLNGLDVYGTQVDDLSVVQGMQLNYLHVAKSNVVDLSPIAGMPLNIIYCQYAKIESIEALRAMPLELIELHGNPITDLSPLTDSTLNTLNARETKITDWSALRSMLSLRIVWLDFVKDRDSEILKSIPTLTEINGQSVHGFWKSVESPSSYDEAVELGGSHFDHHQYDLAIQHYTTAIGFNSSKAHPYCRRGECYFHAEAYTESLQDYLNATDLEPDNPICLDRLANAHFHLRQFDNAVVVMEKAIALNPPQMDRFKKSCATMLSNRAFTYSQDKNYSDAIADLDKALELDPAGKSLHRQRASCYFNIKEFEKALPDFDEAIRRNPSISSYYLHRGYCLQALGRNDEADRDFKKAEELGLK